MKRTWSGTISQLVTGKRTTIYGASLVSSSGTITGGHVFDLSGDIPWNIDGGEVAWTASTNVTSTADTTIYKHGKASAKHVIAAGFTTGLASYRDLPIALDLSMYDGVAFWIYASIATAATDLEFLLDDTAAAASALETLAIPALAATTWTLVVLPFASPRASGMEAIKSIGLNVAAANIAAIDVYVDMVCAVKSITSHYLTSVPVGKVRRWEPRLGSDASKYGLYAKIPTNGTMQIEYEA